MNDKTLRKHFTLQDLMGFPMQTSSDRKSLSRQSIHRSLSYLVLCFSGLACVSILRFFWIGNLKVDDLSLSALQQIVLRLLLGCFLGLSSWIFWRLLSAKVESLHLKSLFFGALVVHLVAAFTLPMTSNDLFSNLAYGEMLRKGIDYHRAGPAALDPDNPFRKLVGSVWLSLPMVYGPLMGKISQWAVQSGSVGQAIVRFKLFSVGCAWMALFLLYQLCRKHLSDSQQTRAFVLFGLNPVFIWEISAQAHNDGLMIVFLVAFIFLTLSQRFWIALLSLALGFFAKFAVLPIFLFSLAFHFHQSRKRALGMIAVVCLLALFFLPSLFEKLTLAMGMPDSDLARIRVTNSISYILAKLFSLGGGDVLIWGERLFWSVSMVSMGILALHWLRKSFTSDQLFKNCFFFLFLYLLLASPLFHPWYIVWLLPLASTLNERRLQDFVAIYAMAVLLQYPITNSFLLGFTNLFFLIAFVRIFWRSLEIPSIPPRALSRKSIAQNQSSVTSK